MWARIGSLFILSKQLGNASQVWVVARKRGPGGVRAVGVVRARGGAFKYSRNTKKMRARSV